MHILCIHCNLCSTSSNLKLLFISIGYLCLQMLTKILGNEKFRSWLEKAEVSRNNFSLCLSILKSAYNLRHLVRKYSSQSYFLVVYFCTDGLPKDFELPSFGADTGKESMTCITTATVHCKGE